MGWLDNACSSYQDGKICKDGFVQVANCHDPRVCSCGSKYKGETPSCLREEFTKAHFTEDGEPRYYVAKTAVPKIGEK